MSIDIEMSGVTDCLLLKVSKSKTISYLILIP